MAAKHTRHVALDEPLTNFVEQRVAEGRYRSASAVVQAALRLLMEREKASENAALRMEPLSKRTRTR